MKKNLSIENIMTVNPVTVYDDDSITKVIQKIRDHDFDHIPVVDKGKNLLGIISKSDLYRQALDLSKSTTGKSYTNKVLFVTTAKEIMTANPVVVTPEHDIGFAIELLLQGNFHALPVVSDSNLVGIITSKDVLEFIIDERIVT